MDRGRGIVKTVIEFYTAEPSFIALTIPQLLPSVFHTDGHLLNRPFSLAKVRKALFDMGPNKVPGLDGFLLAFLWQFWDILHPSI